MSIVFVCPVCGRRLEFDDTLKGTTQCCPQCDSDLLVWPVSDGLPPATGPKRAAAPSRAAGRIAPEIGGPAWVSPVGRGRIWLVGLVGALVVGAVVVWAVTQDGASEAPVAAARSRVERQLAKLRPDERLDRLLEQGGIPRGVSVGVAGVLDTRTLIVTSGGAAGTGQRVYALMVSAQAESVAQYERLQRKAQSMVVRGRPDDGYRGSSFLDEWQLLETILLETLPSRAIIVQLNLSRHPEVITRVADETGGDLGRPIRTVSSYQRLPVPDINGYWAADAKGDPLRAALDRLAAEADQVAPADMVVRRIATPSQVAMFFQASPTGRQLAIAGAYAEK